MSRLGMEAGQPCGATSRALSTALSLAQRTQLALEGIGSASNLLVLTGVAAGLAGSFLSRAAIDTGFGVDLL
jgi:hypothetical protein